MLSRSYISHQTFSAYDWCVEEKNNSVRPVVLQAPSRFSQYKEHILPVQWMETAQLQDTGTLLAESSLKRENGIFIFFFSLRSFYFSEHITYLSPVCLQAFPQLER